MHSRSGASYLGAIRSVGASCWGSHGLSVLHLEYGSRVAAATSARRRAVRSAFSTPPTASACANTALGRAHADPRTDAVARSVTAAITSPNRLVLATPGRLEWRPILANPRRRRSPDSRSLSACSEHVHARAHGVPVEATANCHHGRSGGGSCGRVAGGR